MKMVPMKTHLLSFHAATEQGDALFFTDEITGLDMLVLARGDNVLPAKLEGRERIEHLCYLLSKANWNPADPEAFMARHKPPPSGGAD